MNCTTKNDCAPTTNGTTSESGIRRTMPACDVWEAADGVHIVAEMPGVEPSAVEVTLERNVLSLRGKAERQRASETTPAVTIEYVRKFQLTDTVDADAIQASSKDGLVRVLVPKKQPTQRKIAVSVG